MGETWFVSDLGILRQARPPECCRRGQSASGQLVRFIVPHCDSEVIQAFLDTNTVCPMVSRSQDTRGTREALSSRKLFFLLILPLRRIVFWILGHQLCIDRCAPLLELLQELLCLLRIR